MKKKGSEDGNHTNAFVEMEVCLRWRGGDRW